MSEPAGDLFPFSTTYQVDDPQHVEWHNEAGFILNQAMQTSGATMQTNAAINFSTYTPTGGISRMLQFSMGNEYDRPWAAWLDEFGRDRVALGYHSRDYATGDYHNAFEIKISTSPTASNPADMRTRFSLSTDAEVGTAAFPSTSTVEINRVVYAADSPIGFILRAPDSSGTTRSLGGMTVSLDASNNTTFLIDAKTPATSNTVVAKLFRNTNAATATFALKRGDGSDTDAFTFDMRGRFTLANTTSVPSTPTGGGVLYVQGGALKYIGSSGTVTTLGAA